jgi:hypothetical protein
MKRSLLLGLLSLFVAAGATAQTLDYSKPILGTIIGIENDQNSPRFQPGGSNLPLFGLFDANHPKNTYDRNSPEWWDNLIEELQYSRVHVALPVSRGCTYSTAELQAKAGQIPAPDPYSGIGNSCPRVLDKLTAALTRNQIPAGGLRVGYFDDTAAYLPANGGAPVDITDLGTTLKLMWDRNMMIFFDTVPSQYWYRDENGRPLVVIWAPAGFFKNVDGSHTAQVNAVFNNLRWLFNNRYGVYPTIYVHRDWATQVPGLDTTLVQGAYGWTDPANGKASGFFTWNGAKMGTVSPGFRDQYRTDSAGNILYYYQRGCGTACREVLRNHGDTFKQGMADAYGQVDGRAAKFVLIEGFANVPESAGFYRSTGADYDFPNQYLNRLRDWADPNPTEFTFQAEGSDYRTGNNMSGNQGGAFSNDDVDVGRLSGHGYYVGWTNQGEVLGFKRVKLPAKPFEIRIKTATPLDRRAVKVTFERQDDLQTDAQANLSQPTTTYGPWTMPIPNTGSSTTFQETTIGVFQPVAGYYNIKVEMATDGVSIDWLQIRETTPDCSNAYPGLENVVGLNEGSGDSRFLCKSHQWYSCGWNSSAPWTINATSGQIVGDFRCDTSAAQWQPLTSSCSDGYSGIDNVVGLNNGTGDRRFLCKSHRWYACNWGGTGNWVTAAQLNQVVGSYQCDGASWLPH